jgi:hypothetical protein
MGIRCPNEISRQVVIFLLGDKRSTHQANQNKLAGRMIAPMIIGGKRSSGIGLPYCLYALVKFVLVEYAMSPVPIAIPTMNAAKGRDPTPGFQPRSSWNEIGYYQVLEKGLLSDGYYLLTASNRR